MSVIQQVVAALNAAASEADRFEIKSTSSRYRLLAVDLLNYVDSLSADAALGRRVTEMTTQMGRDSSTSVEDFLNKQADDAAEFNAIKQAIEASDEKYGRLPADIPGTFDSYAEYVSLSLDFFERVAEAVNGVGEGSFGKTAAAVEQMASAIPTSDLNKYTVGDDGAIPLLALVVRDGEMVAVKQGEVARDENVLGYRTEDQQVASIKLYATTPEEDAEIEQEKSEHEKTRQEVTAQSALLCNYVEVYVKDARRYRNDICETLNGLACDIKRETRRCTSIAFVGTAVIIAMSYIMLLTLLKP